MWQQWINAILGLWVVAVPFLGFVGDTLTWTLAITGLVIAAMGAWGAIEHQNMTTKSEYESPEARLRHRS
jgi:hypothetical protein